MSRKLSDLHSIVQLKAEEFIKKCKQSNLNIVIYQTLRTHAEQNKLYAQGRTKRGRIVTNASGGYSYHNYGMAFDFAFRVGIRGVSWRGDWKKAGEIAKNLGLEWGGDWSNFPDRPHCQYTGGLSIDGLRHGKRLPEPSKGLNKQEFRIYRDSPYDGAKFYILGVHDNLWHHITDEGLFFAVFGSFDIEAQVGPPLPKDKIGFSINSK